MEDTTTKFTALSLLLISTSTKNTETFGSCPSTSQSDIIGTASPCIHFSHPGNTIKNKLKEHITLKKSKNLSQTSTSTGPVTCPSCSISFMPSSSKLKYLRKIELMKEIESSDKGCLRYTGGGGFLPANYCNVFLNG